MKWYWWTLISVASLFTVLYTYVKLIQSKIDICIKPSKLELKTLNIAELLSLGQTNAKIYITLRISNRNKINIRIKDFKLTLYYNKVIIAKSFGKGYDLNIEENSKKEFTEPIEISVNKGSTDLVSDLIKNDKIDIKFKINFLFFNFPVTYSDTFVFDKNAPSDYKNCY